MCSNSLSTPHISDRGRERTSLPDSRDVGTGFPSSRARGFGDAGRGQPFPRRVHPPGETCTHAVRRAEFHGFQI